MAQLMSPAVGELHHEAVRLPPAEPSDRQSKVGPVIKICPCPLTPNATPNKFTRASLATRPLARGQGCPDAHVLSISRAAIPARRTLGPSAHQIGPSPSQTCVGVHSKVCPLGMTGTSAKACLGDTSKNVKPMIKKNILSLGISDLLTCPSHYRLQQVLTFTLL
jgi:hypothetical protein